MLRRAERQSGPESLDHDSSRVRFVSVAPKSASAPIALLSVAPMLRNSSQAGSRGLVRRSRDCASMTFSSGWSVATRRSQNWCVSVSGKTMRVTMSEIAVWQMKGRKKSSPIE